MKIHLRYILSSVLVYCHSQPVLIQNKAVLYCCRVLVRLEETNLSWPAEALKYGFWYYCLSECRICSNLIELLYGAYLRTAWNKSHLLNSTLHPCWDLRSGPCVLLSSGYFHLKSPAGDFEHFPVRTLIPPGLPLPLSTAQDPIQPPGLSVPAPVRPQQGWSPVLHSPALLNHGPCPIPVPKEVPNAQDRVAPTALLLIGVVGWDGTWWAPQLQALWPERSVGPCCVLSSLPIHTIFGAHAVIKEPMKYTIIICSAGQILQEGFAPSVPSWCLKGILLIQDHYVSLEDIHKLFLPFPHQ